MDGTALLPLSSHAAKCKSGKLLDWATVITSDFIGGEIRGQATRRDRGASAIVVRRALGQHRAETTWREAAAQQPRFKELFKVGTHTATGTVQITRIQALERYRELLWSP